MSTRRNLLLTRDQIADSTRPQRDKVVTLRDLSQTRVIVPNEVHDTGMSVIVTVANDGRLQPGLIESSKMPVTRPITDLTKLNRARNVVSSLEVAQTRSSSVDEVKETLALALVENKVDVKTVQFKAGIQAELIRCKVLSDALTENETSFSKNHLNDIALYKDVAANWFKASQASITLYILHVQCGPQNQKLLEIVSENLVPRWFFNRFSVKVPELATISVDNIFFPKKISKMITFTAAEAESDQFYKNSGAFHQNLLYLRRVLKLHVTKDKTAVLYPIPGNFTTRIQDFSDLPTIDRVLNASTTLTITLLHMIFDAIPLKALSVDTLSDHIGSFLYENGDIENEIITSLPCKFDDPKGYEDILLAYGKYKLTDGGANATLTGLLYKRRQGFFYDPDSSVPMKAQYREYLVVHLRDPVGIHFAPHYGRMFHLTDPEIKSVSIVMFDREGPIPPAVYPACLFKEYDKTKISDESLTKARERLNVIKPVDIKELNFGPVSSPLGEKAKAFMKGLDRGKFPPIFIKNVTSYLQSFNLVQFQDQAVKIMIASLQSKEVIIESSEPTQTSVKEDEIPDLGDF